MSSCIKRKIIFSLLRSIGLCLKGSRSIRENENIVKSIENDAFVSEGLTNGLTKGLKNVSDQKLVKEH